VPSFRELSEHELDQLSDEELVAYIVRARDSGHLDAAVTGAQLLVFRYEDAVRGFVFNRIGDLGDTVCDQVAGVALGDAAEAAAGFRGDTLGQFRGLVFKITRLRIVDHHRGRYQKDGTIVREEPLEPDRGDDGPARELGGDDPTDERIERLHRGSVFKRVFSKLNRVHQMVILLVKFKDLPHREVADQVNRHFEGDLNDPMTEQNVNKINSRFDQEMDKLLDEDDPPAGNDDD
jgi:DNA-directed RNA polymerase specialized sigma24 family protein